MNICGFQKTTLLDYPEKVACTVFLSGCNFRCPFCHNSGLVTKIDTKNTYKEKEIIDYIKKRNGILDGVCITGGEPLLSENLENFLIKIKDTGLKIKLDTNGSFPERLKEIAGNGLIDYVAMDIKNSKEKYSETADIRNLDISKIEESINFLINGKIDYEFRTTVVKEFHTLNDIEKIGKWISGAKKYYLQKFIDSGNLIGENMTEIPEKEMIKMKNIAEKYIKTVELRGI